MTEGSFIIERRGSDATIDVWRYRAADDYSISLLMTPHSSGARVGQTYLLLRLQF